MLTSVFLFKFDNYDLQVAKNVNTLTKYRKIDLNHFKVNRSFPSPCESFIARGVLTLCYENEFRSHEHKTNNTTTLFEDFGRGLFTCYLRVKGS